MGAHVEWTTASSAQVSYATSREEMPDGQRIDQGKWALAIGDACESVLVVEGNPKELVEFSVRVQTAAMAALRADCDAAYERVTGQ